MTNTVVYPGAINRACALLDEAPLFADLPDGYLRVLVRLVKKINLARPGAAIVASRATIASESGKSVETVNRALKWLEDRGLIERSQKARAGLRGSSSPVTPTKQLIQALLLDAPLVAAKKPADTPARNALPPACPTESSADSRQATCPQHAAPSPVNPDGSKSGEYKQSLTRKQSSETFCKIQGFAIPADLGFLVVQGMSATAVLKLMAAAKRVNQRLSDVVRLTRSYLDPLRGRELYAYLRALLSKNKDYGYVLRMAEEQGRGEQKEREDRERVERKSAELLGRSFKNRDGVVYHVEAGGMIVQIRGERRAAMPMSVRFLDALADGRLVSCHA